jgi:hypothetical protein
VYLERSANLWKIHIDWLLVQAGRIATALDSASTSDAQMDFMTEAAIVRRRAMADPALPVSFRSAVLSDFTDDVSALPQDELPNANAQPHAVDQPDQPFHIDPSIHPLLAFFSTMLPSSGGVR